MDVGKNGTGTNAESGQENANAADEVDEVKTEHKNHPEKPEQRHVENDRPDHSARDSSNIDQNSIDKDRRMFARKKACWFCAKNDLPDWKDPFSYAWLVNEFGKISPARVTGVCSKHQRKATTAIKRGRDIGFISAISNQSIR